MPDIERLKRYTQFVDGDENDQRPRHHNSLKRSQPSPIQETATKNRLSLDETSKIIKKPPRIPLTIKNNNRSLPPNRLIPIVPGSPWDWYERTYARDLAGRVAIAFKLPVRGEQVIVRSLS